MSSEWKPPNSSDELKQFVNSMVDGDYTLDPPFRDLMCESLTKCKFPEELKATTDNQTRVDLVSPIFPRIQFRDILNSIDNVLTKSKPVFDVLKSSGKAFNGMADKEKALTCCTLALSYAPTQDSVAEAFLDRAAIFVEMNKHKLAQVDYKNAELTFADESQLLDYDSLESPCNPKTEGSGQAILNIQPTLTDLISVQYDPNKGRYLVAKTDLEPGTMVFEQNPFVSIPINQLNWQVKHCACCLKETLNPIACKGCVFCIYCGEECRSKHQKQGHEFECPILPYLHSNKLSKNLHLCLKSVCKAGPKVLKQLYDKSKSEVRNKDAWIVPASVALENFDPYSRVLNMASHNRSFEMPFAPWNAVSLAYALRIKTTFFNNIKRSETYSFENFIATIIMHHSESFAYNTMALNAIGVEMPNIKTYFATRSYTTFPQIGSGIFPKANLMNHSCVASTFRVNLSGGRIAIITNRHLKTGEELSHGYGVDYMGDLCDLRRKYIFEYFDFHCECVACSEGWPMFKDLQPPCVFLCPPCRANIHDLLSKSPISEIELGRFKSERCTSKDEPNSSSAEMCNPFSYILDLSYDLLLQNKPHEAVSLLKECIKHFQNAPCQPSIQLIMAQTRLMDSFDIILGRVVVAKEVELVEIEEANEGGEN